jgi:hypothetical protein
VLELLDRMRAANRQLQVRGFVVGNVL